MAEKKPNIRVPVIIAVIFAIAVLALATSRLASHFLKNEESPVSGTLAVAADSLLAPVITRIGESFVSYYPDAVLDVQKKRTQDLIYDFAMGRIQAAVLTGEPTEEERAVIDGNGRSFRLEPVARGAVVCLAHTNSSSMNIGIDALHDLYTSGTSPEGLKPFINGEDQRFQRLVMALIAPDARHLTAWKAASDREVFETVMRDPAAIGFLPVTSVRAFMSEMSGSPRLPVIAAVTTGSENPAVLPSQDAIYEGRYPLCYTLYYLYDPYLPLATGFGAWMTEQGQKGFMRSALAPYRLPSRTIHLD
ncbi:MAG: hypothetical protein C1942_08755 [Prosthecochloris sp.]|uniref:substrate-binding domain-containing protein n=1 Tax=Prosthecochloris sp. TaxID=290513 RepID=UPI0013CB9BB2|nr:substrate-binding domain-containing protein [Prosthecochloris sp.]NEX12754.1 hypothetical protein [Prosthecochloris sp.]